MNASNDDDACGGDDGDFLVRMIEMIGWNEKKKSKKNVGDV